MWPIEQIRPNFITYSEISQNHTLFYPCNSTKEKKSLSSPGAN